MLPAGILQRYQVVTDYQKRTLTFTQSRTVKPQGVAVPFHINQETGLIAVDALIDGRHYPITIDNGSAYTWLRQSTAKNWLPKPADSYPDYHAQVTTYVAILSGPAQRIDPTANAKTFPVIEADKESDEPFH